jgi:hypothetical protein
MSQDFSCSCSHTTPFDYCDYCDAYINDEVDMEMSQPSGDSNIDPEMGDVELSLYDMELGVRLRQVFGLDVSDTTEATETTGPETEEEDSESDSESDSNTLFLTPVKAPSMVTRRQPATTGRNRRIGISCARERVNRVHAPRTREYQLIDILERLNIDETTVDIAEEIVDPPTDVLLRPDVVRRLFADAYRNVSNHGAYQITG